MDVKTRQRIERRIVKAVIDSALKAGHTVSVSDGENDWEVRFSTDRKAILAALFTMDEDYIVVHDVNGGRVGAVRFVYGNDGYDVICDYAAPVSRGGPDSLEGLLAEANRIADLEEKRHG